MSYYDNHLGVLFGANPIIGDGTGYPGETGTLIGWDGNHSFRTFGLYPRKKPVISAPDVQTIYFDVPGRDGMIDASQALDGELHFKNRKAEFQYTQPGGRDIWDKTYYNLKNYIHGKEMIIVLDEEPDGYFIGRMTVENPEYDDKRKIAFFTIKGELDPYKRSWTRSFEPWLWDPFSFQTGRINSTTQRTHIAEPGPVGLVQWQLIGNRQPVVPHIYLEKDPNWDYTSSGGDGTPHINMSWWKYGDEANKKTVRLIEGDNIDLMPDFILKFQQYYYIEISGESGDPHGIGYVWADFREGWL